MGRRPVRRDRRARRETLRRAVGSWPLAAVAGAAAYGLWLRRRVTSLPVLDAADDAVSGVGAADDLAGGPALHVVTATGVTVDPATARAARRHARRHGLDVLDLVPGDLPAERLVDLVRRVDPRTFRDDPFALGVGAGCALVVSDDVATRAAVALDARRDEVDLLLLMRSLRRHAPFSSGHALAPRLRRPRPAADLAWRRAALEAFFSLATPAAVTLRGAQVAAVAALAARGRRALVLAAAHALVLPVALAGTAARPRHLVRHTVLRLPGAALDAVGLARVAAPTRPPTSRRDAERRAARASSEEVGRAAYERAFATGTDRLLGPRHAECPVCGGHALAARLELGDLYQRKPGRFTLERCGDCGLVFQNPPVTPEGLDLYYRDFYDGVGEEQTELAFGSQRASYAHRVAWVAARHQPRRWLDVGGGHGHFCLVARRTWPAATFDAIDLATSIEEAERRGWVDHGMRGRFPDVAPRLAEAYDVVSMHHYLEHTRDPAAEIEAARTVLEPGGLLLVEMPDPTSAAARLLGRWWCAHLQPQHLHMPPIDLLERMLAERGFAVIDRHRTQAHQGGDLTGATYLAVNRLGPPVDVPWRPPAAPVHRTRRAAVLVGALPVLAAAAAADAALAALVPLGLPLSNAYRVLARRDD